MRNMKFLFVVLCLGMLAAAPALGQGFYLGAGIGNTFFSDDYQDALDEVHEIDENSTAWKIFGGFNAGKFLGVEAGYRDFGNIESDEHEFESNTKGFDIEAVGKIQIAIIDVFAKVGVMFWETDLKAIDEDTLSADGTDLLWGLGAGVSLGKIGLRLEWESLEADGPNMSMVSLGATLGF